MESTTLAYYYQAILDYEESGLGLDALRCLVILETGLKSEKYLHAKFCEYAIEKIVKELFIE